MVDTVREEVAWLTVREEVAWLTQTLGLQPNPCARSQGQVGKRMDGRVGGGETPRAAEPPVVPPAVRGR